VINSCAHFPFGISNNAFDTSLKIKPFALSTAPLLFKWFTDTKAILISSSPQKFLNSAQSNYFPLSTVMKDGTPKQQMILCHTKLINVLEVIFASALASIHLVKYSRATAVKRKLPGVVGNGPTISTPHLCKGHVGMIDLVRLAGVLCFLVNIYQFLQLRTSSFASGAAVGQ